MNASLDYHQFHRTHRQPILHYEGEIEIVGTLSQGRLGSTLSMHTLREWGQAAIIRGFSSFEDAVQSVLDSDITAAWVPGAYSGIARFIHDPRLEVLDTVLMELPPVVLAGPTQTPPDKADYLFFHPATASYLTSIDFRVHEHVPVTSTTLACEKMMGYSGPSLAITSRFCVHDYGAHEYAVLNEHTKMPFSLFGRC